MAKRNGERPTADTTVPADTATQGNTPVQDNPPSHDDTAAREAAEFAVELSETDSHGNPRRIAGALKAVTERVSGVAETARNGTRSARQGAGSARRGASRGAGNARRGVTSGLNWLSGQVVAMGPRLKIRDQAELRVRFPGLSDEQIAERLVDRAARATAAVGGATGAWSALPVLPAFPAEIAAETLAVVGIEIKLVAELHEVYGQPATGSSTERARAYIGAWAGRRGIYEIDGGLLLVAGSPLARQLTRRLAARVRRSAFSLAPLFAGALAGAVLNRRETKKLGKEIRDDLRRRGPMITGRVTGRGE